MINEGDQIITLEAGQEFSRERMAVESIICRGTAAGAFDIVFGNTSLLLNNTTSDLTMQFQMNRSVNFIRLEAAPTGGRLYVILEKKR